MVRFKFVWIVILAGGVFGLLFAFLIKLGNPSNMGVCAVCFTRDLAGALGLHRVEKLSYIRPEVVAFILGAWLMGLIKGEFRSHGGSSPLLRFIIGGLIGIGALVFLGCPIRMVGRLAGGDPTAFIGLLGFIVGVWIGALFLKAGFTLGRALEVSKANAWVVPISAIFLLILGILSPSFIVRGSKVHAPFIFSLFAGLIIGGLAQRARLCFAGGIRDLILIRDFHLFQGLVAFFIFCFLGNLIFGQFHPGAYPIAHTDHLASFLGMIVVGLGSVMIGGCPFRQMILAGYGNTDSGITLLGMLGGTAFAHNFLIAASPLGVPTNGMIAVSCALIILLIIGFTNREK